MKSVLITGASGGLGYALVREFVHQDFFVYTIVREKEELERLNHAFANHCVHILGDLAENDITYKIHKAIEDHTQSLDILINNAGLQGEVRKIEDIKEEELMELMQVNCFACIKTVQGALPFLKKVPQAIVLNISSRMASLTKTARGEYWHRNFSYAYRISKAAQNMLTICLNHELSELGIGVVGIHPGKLNTKVSSTPEDMTPEESAHKIFEFVRDIQPNQYGQFIYPGVEELEW